MSIGSYASSYQQEWDGCMYTIECMRAITLGLIFHHLLITLSENGLGDFPYQEILHPPPPLPRMFKIS